MILLITFLNEPDLIFYTLLNSFRYYYIISIFQFRLTFHHHHHHHHDVPLARISQAFSRHFSLSFIASGRSSGLHPGSSHSCCMSVRAGRLAFARPYVEVHRSTSLMSSSLLLHQCPACLVRLTWIVFVMGGRWPYNWCLVGCCRQDLFNIARSILVELPSSFFSSCFVTVNLFQVLLFNTNNPIQHYPFVYIQLDGSEYC